MPDFKSEQSKKKDDLQKNISLGALYSRIKTDSSLDDNRDKKITNIKDPKYVSWCKKAYKMFPSLAKGNLHKKVKNAVLFLGWKLRPEEYDAFVMTVTVFGLAILFVLLILVFIVFTYLASNLSNFDYNPLFFIMIAFVVFGGAIGCIIYYFMNYPLAKAEEEKRNSLAYLPSIVGYLTMYLKLVPNLERAIVFAGKQGEGHLADEFRKIVWDTSLGIYYSVSEGLDYLAYRWKAYSMDFKESVMMIKSAMVEDNEARRTEILDKTVDNLLDSIKLKMESYAKSLSQPSLVLFYIGVLLPLLLVIILPIGSVFAKLPFSNPYVLFALYDVAIPLFVFFYAKKISRKVPLLYKSPVIPDNYKGVPRKGFFRIGKFEMNLYVFLGFVFILGLGLTILLQFQFGSTLKKVMIKDNLPQKFIDNPQLYFEQQADNYMASTGKVYSKDSDKYKEIVSTQKMLYSLKPHHDTTPYFVLYGLALLLALLIALYCFFSAKYKKKVQNYYIDMEKNFREVLFILASRLSEGKPMETALKETKNFFPDLVISQDLLAKTLDNINLLGMPLDQALFDPLFGSLRHNPSLMIRNNMKIIADSSKLGVGTVAKTILSISLQLKNIEDIRISVKKLTSDVRQMMSTMATLIAPAVLGMVSAIQKVVILTLSSLGSSNMSSSSSNVTASVLSNSSLASINPTKMMGAVDPSSIGSIASPFAFNLILIINLILVVIGLVYFISRVQSDSPLDFKMNVLKIVPIAIFVFIIAAIGSGFLLSGVGG